jgi:hypothetical protein
MCCSRAGECCMHARARWEEGDGIDLQHESGPWWSDGEEVERQIRQTTKKFLVRKKDNKVWRVPLDAYNTNVLVLSYYNVWYLMVYWHDNRRITLCLITTVIGHQLIVMDSCETLSLPLIHHNKLIVSGLIGRSMEELYWTLTLPVNEDWRDAVLPFITFLFPTMLTNI